MRLWSRKSEKYKGNYREIRKLFWDVLVLVIFIFHVHLISSEFARLVVISLRCSLSHLLESFCCYVKETLRDFELFSSEVR